MQHRPSADDVLAVDHHWYHCVDLADGRTTPGWIDLRAVVDVPGLPATLTGLRALDVGTYDGFWAFELERRGAQVLGLDTDEIPPPDTPRANRAAIAAEVAGREPGAGFRILKEHLGSSVRRVPLNVYDLTVDALDGPVDLVFLGAMLLHLRDPVGALERVRDVLAPGGALVLFEPVDVRLSRKKEPLARYLARDTTWTWWYPNEACLLQWVETAGFADVQRGRSADVQPSDGPRQRLVAVTARR
jgi:tRNA (mo5U34)-methyltransferase